MTSIRKLALALCLAGSFSFSNATADTTGDLINNNNWSGATYGADPGGCCASISGSGPLYDTTTDVIMFSYGQATISQTIGLQQALGGTGVQVNGYNYSWDYRLVSNNGNANDNLTANISLKDSQGIVVQSQNFSYTGAAHDIWYTESGTTTFASPYIDPQSLTLSFSGRDGGFWAGYYGPELRNISLTVNYTFDPCAADPLYSPTCPGYAEAYKNLMCNNNPLYDQTCPGYAAVTASSNLVPHPGGQTGFFGGSLNNSFAISTALSHGGAGLMVHGFQWGYRATNYSVFGSSVGSSTVNVNIRDGDGTILHSWSRNNTTAGTRNYSSSYILPESINNLDMGNFNFTASSTGFGIVDSMWARALITPDQCTTDPLSSVLCTKYEEAFLAQQCSITALYSPSCPGYLEAMAEMLAASMPNGVESTDSTSPVMVVAQTSTSGPSPVDETKDPSQVTTDIGGVEMSTTGELIVSDSVPSAAKESSKSSSKEESSREEKTTEKKTLSRDQLRSIADRAVRETEKTAMAAADASVDQSRSEAANPSDGTGATVDLGGGLSLRDLQSMTMAGQLQAGPQTLPRRDTVDDIARYSSLRSQISETSESSYGLDSTRSIIDQNVSTPVHVDQNTDESTVAKQETRESSVKDLTNLTVVPSTPAEPQAPAGPAVRRGGKVDGMEGGADMSSLAAAPADFNDYLSQQLQDAQFYASKDIYRGQRNVDNARALRGLGTDVLHQQMIDQQYNQGAK